MLKKVTPEKVIYIIRLSVAICCCWPRPFNSTKNQIFGFKVLQISTIISAFMVFLPLLYSIYLHNDNIIHVFKCICLSVGITQLIVQTLICFIKHNSLQVSSYILYISLLYNIWMRNIYDVYIINKKRIEYV